MCVCHRLGVCAGVRVCRGVRAECVCVLLSVSVRAECESVRVTRRLCIHVCPLAVCVCACHSEGVWVRMSVCHGERVPVREERRAREREKLIVYVLPVSVEAMCQNVQDGCVTETDRQRQRN